MVVFDCYTIARRVTQLLRLTWWTFLRLTCQFVWASVWMFIEHCSIWDALYEIEFRSSLLNRIVLTCKCQKHRVKTFSPILFSSHFQCFNFFFYRKWQHRLNRAVWVGNSVASLDYRLVGWACWQIVDSFMACVNIGQSGTHYMKRLLHFYPVILWI